MKGFLKEVGKKLAKGLLADYSIYRIYTLSGGEAGGHEVAEGLTVREIDETSLASDPSQLIRDQSGYAGPGSHAYACIENGRVAGICFYWFGERYKTRNFWPLAEGEAKLVQIVVLPEMRGRGIATQLIASSFQDMMGKDFHRAYARIWHSNAPSLKAFRKAGWKPVALVVEFFLRGRSRPLRIRLNG